MNKKHDIYLNQDEINLIINNNAKCIIINNRIDIKLLDTISLYSQNKELIKKFKLSNEPTYIILRDNNKGGFAVDLECVYYNKYLGCYSPDLSILAKDVGFSSFNEMALFFNKKYPKKKRNNCWEFNGRIVFFDNPTSGYCGK